MQQTPASQAEPVQQLSPVQDLPAAAQAAPVDPLLLLTCVEEAPVVEPPVELRPEEPPPELAPPLELPPSEVLLPPLEEAWEPPDELPPPLTGMLFPGFEQEIASPIAPRHPSSARLNSVERFNRSPRSP
jgi:hypothetical protein